MNINETLKIILLIICLISLILIAITMCKLTILLKWNKENERQR